MKIQVKKKVLPRLTLRCVVLALYEQFQSATDAWAETVQEHDQYLRELAAAQTAVAESEKKGKAQLQDVEDSREQLRLHFEHNRVLLMDQKREIDLNLKNNDLYLKNIGTVQNAEELVRLCVQEEEPECS